jgi:hypothetical protein
LPRNQAHPPRRGSTQRPPLARPPSQYNNNQQRREPFNGPSTSWGDRGNVQRSRPQKREIPASTTPRPYSPTRPFYSPIVVRQRFGSPQAGFSPSDHASRDSKSPSPPANKRKRIFYPTPSPPNSPCYNSSKEEYSVEEGEIEYPSDEVDQVLYNDKPPPM